MWLDPTIAIIFLSKGNPGTGEMKKKRSHMIVLHEPNISCNQVMQRVWAQCVTCHILWFVLLVPEADELQEQMHTCSHLCGCRCGCMQFIEMFHNETTAMEEIPSAYDRFMSCSTKTVKCIFVEVNKSAMRRWWHSLDV